LEIAINAQNLKKPPQTPKTPENIPKNTYKRPIKTLRLKLFQFKKRLFSVSIHFPTFFHLDSEQRLHAAKVIKRFVLNAKKTAFIVEHDFIMATYMADRVMQHETKTLCTKMCAF